MKYFSQLYGEEGYLQEDGKVYLPLARISIDASTTLAGREYPSDPHPYSGEIYYQVNDNDSIEVKRAKRSYNKSRYYMDYEKKAREQKVWRLNNAPREVVINALHKAQVSRASKKS